MDSAEQIWHEERRLTDPAGWVLYVSHSAPSRLVVFVHGFAGNAVETWRTFPDGGRTQDWWRKSDMLFVGYDSKRDTITGTADRLRRRLDEFYPILPARWIEEGDVCVRLGGETRYSHLTLVGHSLGAVIVRRSLCEAAHRWLDARQHEPSAPRPRILDAEVRLFSPASAGFRAAGALGLMAATPFWRAAEMYLRRSSAFTDLQPGSELLTSTRRRTEKLVASHAPELSALRAHVMWSNPDDVVITERYDSDHADQSVDDTTHSSVCKPCDGYELPWTFVEQGEVDERSAG
jgi:hypothetical protein